MIFCLSWSISDRYQYSMTMGLLCIAPIHLILVGRLACANFYQLTPMAHLGFCCLVQRGKAATLPMACLWLMHRNEMKVIARFFRLPCSYRISRASILWQPLIVIILCVLVWAPLQLMA